MSGRPDCARGWGHRLDPNGAIESNPITRPRSNFQNPLAVAIPYSSHKANKMASTNYHIVNSPAHFQELLSADLNRVSLINFWAPWAAPCEQMNEVVIELAKKYPTALVLQVWVGLSSCNLHWILISSCAQVEAEEQEDISESFEIDAVPSFIILRVCQSLSGLYTPNQSSDFDRDIHCLSVYLAQTPPL
jgi:thiol-disulfide isomerase/thioredoxin